MRLKLELGRGGMVHDLGVEGGWGQKMGGGDVVALPLEEVRSKDGEGLCQERVTRHAVERLVGVCSSGIDPASIEILFGCLDMSATVRSTKGGLCESSVSGDAKTVKAFARNGSLDTLSSDQSAFAAVALTRHG